MTNDEVGRLRLGLRVRVRVRLRATDALDEPAASGGGDNEGTGWGESFGGVGMLSNFPDQGQENGSDEDLAQFNA